MIQLQSSVQNKQRNGLPDLNLARLFENQMAIYYSQKCNIFFSITSLDFCMTESFIFHWKSRHHFVTTCLSQDSWAACCSSLSSEKNNHSTMVLKTFGSAWGLSVFFNIFFMQKECKDQTWASTASFEFLISLMWNCSSSDRAKTSSATAAVYNSQLLCLAGPVLLCVAADWSSGVWTSRCFV